MSNNNKFIKSEARILCYGPECGCAVFDANNHSQEQDLIGKFGKPNVCMKGFDTFQEMKIAKACYEYELSALNGKSGRKPAEDALCWFYTKQELDEYYPNIAQVVEKYDDLLPNLPARKISKKPNFDAKTYIN